MIMQRPTMKKSTYYQSAKVQKPYALEIMMYSDTAGIVRYDIQIYHEDLSGMRDCYFERDFKRPHDCLVFALGKLDVYAASKKNDLKQTYKDKTLIQDWFLHEFAK